MYILWSLGNYIECDFHGSVLNRLPHTNRCQINVHTIIITGEMKQARQWSGCRDTCIHRCYLFERACLFFSRSRSSLFLSTLLFARKMLDIPVDIATTLHVGRKTRLPILYMIIITDINTHAQPESHALTSQLQQLSWELSLLS